MGDEDPEAETRGEPSAPAGDAAHVGDAAQTATAAPATAEPTADEPTAVAEPAASPTRTRSPLIAALLSFLWPGLGQAFQGRRRLAAVYALSFLAIAGWAVAQLGDGLVGFGLNMLDDGYALTVALMAALAGLIRVAATAQPLLRRPGSRRSALAHGAAGAVLLAAILVPHAYVAGNAWLVRQADLAIAANNDQFAGASPSPTPSPTPAPTPTPSPTPRDTSPFFPATTPAPSIGPSAPPVAKHLITFLLIGIDFMTGRTHHLTDTLMVASIDTKTSKVYMISVPRDTAGFDLYFGGYAGTNFKINAMLSSLESGSFKSPDKPMATLKKEIGFLVGIPIDYYAAVDLEGFPAMVDAVGGVDFDNKYAINDPFTGTFVPVGPVHLDGPTALKYVRSRMSSSDYQRAARQQDIIVALEQKLLTPEILPSLPALITVAGQTISTDFPLKTAKNYVKMLQRIHSTSQCVLQPPYSYHPDSSTTNGWTSRLDIARVATLSVAWFGADSRYYGIPGVVARPCAN
jgi:polyisoprenyl-teichoic acid--peptidoglycan teichoic acid transferase